MTEAPGNYAQLPVDKIVPSPYQQRRSFGGTEDKELAESVREHGVLQPIRVRPNGKPGTFELVFGERRWRAACAAELDLIPAIVVDLTDDQVIKQLIEENLQRKDVHPIEEGDGYYVLMHKHGYTEEQLLAITKKSKAYIYGRIKLARNLAPGPKKAVLEGQLQVVVAELIARIPDHKMQDAAMKDCLGLTDLGYDVGVAGETIRSDDGKRHREDQPLSYRAAVALIRRKYQTKLALASFDTTDATLIAKVGACTTCPHRSGNQPELPGLTVNGAKPEDHCTKPSCFEDKVQAQFKRVADKARAEGKTVVEGKKAEAMFYNNGELKSDSSYVAPDQRLPYDVVHSYDDKHTFKKLLGKHIAEVPTAIVQDIRGTAVEVLDKKKAIEVLREHKLLPKRGSSSGMRNGSSTAAEKKAAKARKEDREKEKLREEAYGVLITAAAAAAENLAASKDAAMWRWVALAIATDYHYTERTMFSERRGLDYDTELEKLIEAAKTGGALRALIVEMMMCKMADSVVNEHGDADEAMDLAKRLFGLDWKKAEKEALAAREKAKETAKAEEKADAAKKAPKKKGKGK